jgi:paraquat-inducible protein A
MAFGDGGGVADAVVTRVGAASSDGLTQTPDVAVERLGCVECDLLVRIGPLAPRERAACPRCGHLLTSNTPDGFTRSLAFALAAALLLAFSLSFPFLSLQASGMEQVMTLPGSAYQLYTGGYPSIAFLVMVPIIGIPALMVALLVGLLLLLRRAAPSAVLVPIGRTLFFLNPWSMVEVFVIGVIVSLVKVGHMAHVVLGISFFSYVAFAICFTAALTNLDRVRLWERIEELTP